MISDAPPTFDFDSEETAVAIREMERAGNEIEPLVDRVEQGSLEGGEAADGNQCDRHDINNARRSVIDFPFRATPR